MREIDVNGEMTGDTEEWKERRVAPISNTNEQSQMLLEIIENMTCLFLFPTLMYVRSVQHVLYNVLIRIRQLLRL
jgi:hypothetical protein